MKNNISHQKKNDEVEDDDESLSSDPGFFIGLAMVLISSCIDDKWETLSDILMIIGLVIMIFYKDIINLFKKIIQDFKGKNP
ncbi:hypothetical protein [Terrilactibacillus laevilacticus]|uniref:hypothetical protein n=1 Tax=Terrilactibacillus laevilacticus TaxID=1380157 RepID=UPI0011476367|nr:hypothetical protein [Terrilactibacillus laevilacticus]